MVVLAHLGSQCTKFHAAGLGSADLYVLLFWVVYLAWAIPPWIRQRNNECESNLVQISENVRRKPWQWLDSFRGRKHEPYTESRNSPRAKKPRQVKSMLIIFFDIKGIVHKYFVLAGQTVNFAYYCNILRRLSENMRRLRLEHWRQNYWLLHQDNASFHTSFFSEEFFYNKITRLSSPTHYNFLYFLDWRKNLKDATLTQVRWSRQNRRRCWTHSQSTTSRMHLKMAEHLERCIHGERNYFDEGDGGQ
jgi:hypothetical protein